jgi:hypothetical protein
MRRLAAIQSLLICVWTRPKSHFAYSSLNELGMLKLFRYHDPWYLVAHKATELEDSTYLTIAGQLKYTAN